MDSRFRGNDNVVNAVFLPKFRRTPKSTYKQQMHPAKRGQIIVLDMGELICENMRIVFYVKL